jgi:SAM-dependent methyltransferase
MQKSKELRPIIRFGKTEEAYDGFAELLMKVIDANAFKRVLDVGGGSQPMLPWHYVYNNCIDYTVLDIAEAEMENAPVQYNRIVGDAAAVGVSLGQAYDFVFSRFVAEHVQNAKLLHENVFSALRPGGMAIHLFPTLFAIPFLVNKLLPEWIALLFLPEVRRKKGKFAAYYKWCFGPSARGVSRFRELGYEVVEYSGFFGHGYYDSIPILRELHSLIRNGLLWYPIAAVTSFAWVILKKPEKIEAGSGEVPAGTAI